MGELEPMIPDDVLQGRLRKAVEQVRRDPVSEDLIERCAARAAEITGLEAIRPIDARLGREGKQDAPNSWHWPALVCLAASLLITISLNALQNSLDRPDPHRQQAALLKTTDQQNYYIYSDLRLEHVSSITAPH